LLNPHHAMLVSIASRPALMALLPNIAVLGVRDGVGGPQVMVNR